MPCKSCKTHVQCCLWGNHMLLCSDYIHYLEFTFTTAALEPHLWNYMFAYVQMRKWIITAKKKIWFINEAPGLAESPIALSCWLCEQSGCSCSLAWVRRWEGGWTLWGVSPSSRKHLASAGGWGWIHYPFVDGKLEVRQTCPYTLKLNVLMIWSITFWQSPVRWRHSPWQTVVVLWGNTTYKHLEYIQRRLLCI